MLLARRFASKPKARRPRKKLAARIMFFCLGLLLLFWCFLSLKDVVYRNIARVETLQPGQLTEKIAVSALLIKQEYLINAPLKGVMKYSVSDGQKVKAGTSLGVLEAPSMDTVSGLKQYAVTTPAGGMFCNHIDGLEAILVPGQLDVVEMPPLDKIDNNIPLNPGGNVEKGAPIAKVIDNLTPIFIAGELEAENFKQLQELKDAEIKLEWQNQLVRVKIDKLENKGEKKAFVLVLKNYPDEILHHRTIDFQIITGEIGGLLIKEEALVSKDNKEGLYIIWKGLVRWVPVKIIKTLNGQAAIEGADIQPGMSYVVNPRFVREGDKL
ncbi:HlyD family efflux transporter periplasmic adaptor subunit [Desulfotomaculum sp. 1211_IL3151]|uniref:HlyD family efflux transporter periplasmic adaptor subunit n=1 Tax=Desulfotomaculum sp. 1211_IL3151 TaxID=3084055 RepID=UPI002FDB1156